LWLAFWAAADKALPMLYGVAVVLVTLRVLSPEEWAIWTVFQVVFMVISLTAEFFILQPMVKIASEHGIERRPVITAASLLYSLFSIGVAAIVVAFADGAAHLMKTEGSASAFRLMEWLILSTLVRNIAIRILQVDYKIIKIFLIDLAYFGLVIGMMLYGMVRHTFTRAEDLIDYNLLSFGISSAVGVLFCARDLLPTLNGLGASIRRIANLGVHQGGTGLLTVLQQQSDLAIVSAVRGGLAAGVYNAARTFYRFFEALRDAVQLLLVPATSRAYSQERIEAVQEVTELATAALVVMIAPMSIGAILLAPYIVPILVPKFPNSIDEFQWLMANGFLMPFVIVPSAVLLGIGHTRDLFRGTLVGTVVLICAGIAFTWFWGSRGMAIAVFTGTSVTALVLTKRMDRYVHFTFRSVLRRSRSFGPIVRKRLADLPMLKSRASGK
jgi:O-antigen/teichoic acid export membrane protein